MKIKKININNFGLIGKKSINLESGINLIYCENKQVKAIIQNFIVCFLYGMENDRKVFRSVYRRKYSPFSMEKTKGELVIEKNNVEYLIERSFGSSKVQDTTHVTRVLDNQEITNLDLDQPGITFLDIGFEAFHRTMFVKNIDDFMSFNNETKLMNDIAKIKENFDRRFSFDKAVYLINSAKDIIKDMKISGNLQELYIRYAKLNDKLDKANKLVHLNSLDESKLIDLNRRREHLINEYIITESSIKHFKYIELKYILDNVSKLEQEISKLEEDFKNINEDITKLNEKPITSEYVSDLKEKVNTYKESKKEILKINKLDLNEETKVFERFEYLSKELDKYAAVKSKLFFYTEKIKIIEKLNKEIENVKGNNRISYLLKNVSRSKKSKTKKKYFKIYMFVILFSILIAILAPVLKFNVAGIIIIAATSLILIGSVYVYSILKDYKEIENKDINSKANKFYDLKNQLSKVEKDLYPYTYYRVKKDVETINRIENELDSLSYRFKEGDLSYINSVKTFRDQEKELFEHLKDFGFEDLFIQDVESFIDNLEFKLNYKNSVEENLKSKNQQLVYRLDGKNKYDLTSEMESLMDYADLEVHKTSDEVNNQHSMLKMELKNIDDEIVSLKENLKSVDNNKYQVEVIKDEIENLQGTISYLESKITNIDMYINKITDIYYEFKEHLSPEISTRIDYLINYLNRDSFGRTILNNSEYEHGGSVLVKQRLGIEFLNVGMWDLIYFSLRITIADLIHEYKGEVPLILDDLFVSYDYDKMKKALMLLEKYSKDRQVILFVSTKRELEYLKGNAYLVTV